MAEGSDKPDHVINHRLDGPTQNSHEELTVGDFDILFNSLAEAQRALIVKLERSIELLRSIKKGEAEEDPLFTLLHEIEYDDLEPFLDQLWTTAEAAHTEAAKDQIMAVMEGVAVGGIELLEDAAEEVYEAFDNICDGVFDRKPQWGGELLW